MNSYKFAIYQSASLQLSVWDVSAFQSTFILLTKQMYRHPQDLPVLYAQNCPDQPIIPSGSSNHSKLPIEEQDKISRAVRVIAKKPNSNHLSNFSPHIIKSPKTVKSFNFKKSHEALQHEREIKSLNKRIKEVKNIQQRKKDKNDPIVYPPYFVRESFQAKDVRIDGFYKKVGVPNFRVKQNNSVLINRNNKNQREGRNQVSDGKETKSKPDLKKYQYSLNMSNPYLKAHATPSHHQPQFQYNYSKNPFYHKNTLYYNPNMHNPQQQIVEQASLPTPIFTTPKKLEQTQKHTIIHENSPQQQERFQSQRKNGPPYRHRSSRNLLQIPENDIRSILNYIYNNSIYKSEDLQILKMRMMHRFGRDEVKNVWNYVIGLLNRDNM